jgi:hypothetical protein
MLDKKSRALITFTYHGEKILTELSIKKILSINRLRVSTQLHFQPLSSSSKCLLKPMRKPRNTTADQNHTFFFSFSRMSGKKIFSFLYPPHSLLPRTTIRYTCLLSSRFVWRGERRQNRRKGR